MKLVNFASLDPAHQTRGVKGLSGHSRRDQEIWKEFEDNWERMTLRSETILQKLVHANTPQMPQSPIEEQPCIEPDRNTETTTATTVRLMQHFFRKMVLASYNSTCCVTGNPVEELLVASHIVPWSDFPEHRLNPRNGLCLAAHFDRAFDRGLITFDDETRLVVSPLIKRYRSNAAINGEFLCREGQRLTPPERFPPEADLLAQHRRLTFRAK